MTGCASIGKLSAQSIFREPSEVKASSSLPIPIKISRVFLDLQNPRHKTYELEDEVIEYLCRKEQVVELAADIVKLERVNPLELFAVIPLEKKTARSALTYFVAEGNRRLCALKLLHDPDRAPSKLRKEFRKLSQRGPQIDEVLGFVFEDREAAAPWLERIHGGAQDGRGRRSWTSEQKTRHNSDKRNSLSQSLLDYAEQQGFITASERIGKITTAQRYLGNTAMREALGIESNDIDPFARTRPSVQFDALVRRFTRDLVSGSVSSRSDATEVSKYARSLADTDGVTGERNEPTSVVPEAKSKARVKRPREPHRPKHIVHDAILAKLLLALPSYKLERLYYSICTLKVEDHAPLLSVGIWSFIETLTALCGRNSGTSFEAYLSRNRIGQLGFVDRETQTSFRTAVERVLASGNATKHHNTSAIFNGEQLVNDMQVLTPLLSKLAEMALLSPATEVND